MPYQHKADEDLSALSNVELGELLGTVMESTPSLNYPTGPKLTGFLLATIRDRLVDPVYTNALARLIDRKSGKETLVGLIDILGYEIKDNELVAKPSRGIFGRLAGFEGIEETEEHPVNCPEVTKSGVEDSAPEAEIPDTISEERREYLKNKLDRLEKEAKEVYDNWNRSGELDPWEDGRRSVMQCKAREVVLCGKHGHEKVSADLEQLYKIRTTPNDKKVILDYPEIVSEPQEVKVMTEAALSPDNQKITPVSE